MQEIDALTFKTAVGETVTVNCDKQMTLTSAGAPINSPFPAPAAGQLDVTVNVFFLPGDPPATVTFKGSQGGSFDRTFRKPENDDFQFKTFTFHN